MVALRPLADARIVFIGKESRAGTAWEMARTPFHPFAVQFLVLCKGKISNSSGHEFFLLIEWIGRVWQQAG